MTTERFGPADRDRLFGRLTALDRQTVLTPIDTPAQVCLDAGGRTESGRLRFSQTAFRQVGHLVAAGLVMLVGDLTGRRRRAAADTPAGFYSAADAVHVFNLLVRRRFEALQGMQFVRDDLTGVVEGVVSANYRRLGNAELAEQAEASVRATDPDAVFVEAVLAGRTLTIRYRRARPHCEVGPGDVFHAGFYYANSEIGDGTIRTFPFLWRAAGGLAFVARTPAGRVRHAGKDFRRRLGRALASTLDRLPSPSDVDYYVTARRAALLGFGGSPDADERRLVSLTRVLANRGLTVGLARRVVRAALVRPAAGGEDAGPGFVDPGSPARRGWNTRSQYDLCCAAAREALGLAAAPREQLEQLAHGLLSGRVQVPPHSSTSR